MTQPNDKAVNEEKIIADKIRRCLTSDDGRVLIHKLRERITNITKQLRSANDPITVHRAQGHLDELELLISFGEE